MIVILKIVESLNINLEFLKLYKGDLKIKMIMLFEICKISNLLIKFG